VSFAPCATVFGEMAGWISGMIYSGVLDAAKQRFGAVDGHNAVGIKGYEFTPRSSYFHANELLPGDVGTHRRWCNGDVNLRYHPD